MTVKLPAQYHLEFLSLKGGCTGSSEFTIVKLSHCWKSLVWLILMNDGQHALIGKDIVAKRYKWNAES